MDGEGGGGRGGESRSDESGASGFRYLENAKKRLRVQNERNAGRWGTSDWEDL